MVAAAFVVAVLLLCWFASWLRFCGVDAVGFGARIGVYVLDAVIGCLG